MQKRLIPLGCQALLFCALETHHLIANCIPHIDGDTPRWNTTSAPITWWSEASPGFAKKACRSARILANVPEGG